MPNDDADLIMDEEEDDDDDNDDDDDFAVARREEAASSAEERALLRSFVAASRLPFLLAAYLAVAIIFASSTMPPHAKPGGDVVDLAAAVHSDPKNINGGFPSARQSRRRLPRIRLGRDPWLGQVSRLPIFS